MAKSEHETREPLVWVKVGLGLCPSKNICFGFGIDVGCLVFGVC